MTEVGSLLTEILTGVAPTVVMLRHFVVELSGGTAAWQGCSDDQLKSSPGQSVLWWCLHTAGGGMPETLWVTAPLPPAPPSASGHARNQILCACKASV